MNFKDKTVWITGASSGIGEALAYEFANQGARIILSARNAKELQRVANGCKTECLIQVLDLANHDKMSSMVDEIISRVGQVDILVNNGGMSQRALVKDAPFEVDKKMIEVNLLGTIALSKALLPHFLENKSGHYLVISSLMGKFAAPLRSSYAAAKHGLHGFFDTLRAECYDDNVKVTLVCPGFIRTNISKNALSANGKAQGTMDDATGKGMLPSVLATKILNAVIKEKEEVLFGGKEILAVYIKRFFPSLLNRIVRKAKVT